MIYRWGKKACNADIYINGKETYITFHIDGKVTYHTSIPDVCEDWLHDTSLQPLNESERESERVSVCACACVCVCV